MKKTKYKFTKLQLDWITDLINGRFTKTTRQLGKSLKKHASYCCLGVACLVARRNGLDISKEINANGDICFDGDDAELGMTLWKEYKLRSGQGDFKSAIDGRASLVALNDDAGWSHKQIGEYILNNPENVFKS